MYFIIFVSDKLRLNTIVSARHRCRPERAEFGTRVWIGIGTGLKLKKHGKVMPPPTKDVHRVVVLNTEWGGRNV